MTTNTSEPITPIPAAISMEFAWHLLDDIKELEFQDIAAITNALDEYSLDELEQLHNNFTKISESIRRYKKRMKDNDRNDKKRAAKRMAMSLTSDET